MYRAARRLGQYDNPVILHLGDHDPSGLDMSRDIADRLEMLGTWVDVQRIALTMPQIERLNPPPNPTKLTDSRAGGYIAEYGYESWELDAIPPDQLNELIRTEVAEWCDDELYEEAVALEETHREAILEAATELDS